uniref:Mucin 2, oligomeric mucus/gel-forming n=1 Tax=Echeneis naucrates TaxID=173247 RepID=A0A665UKP3_ECHNA
MDLQHNCLPEGNNNTAKYVHLNRIYQPYILMIHLPVICRADAPNHVNSICSTWGRGNFKTFDGAVYQFPGMCEYNLASDCHETYSEFSVHMKREERDGNPTVSYLVVTINDLSFNVNRQQTTINDEKINLPYYNSGVEVENYYVYIKLHSKVGVTVMWNYDDAVMVEVHQDYANRTCGLCGDFNGFSVQNEFVHDDRQISPIEFGNNYKVHLPNYECEDPDEEDEDPQAAQNVTACKDWSPCTRLIDPQPYIQACAQDMCGCNNTDDCVCSTYSEFSRQCSHAGGNPPNWRTSTFCEKVCPFNMIFQESGSPCMNTCSSQDRTSLCEEHKMDGCFCPPGTVFDDVSKRGCIALSECQCKHNRIYNSSEVYCTCLEGKWVCKTHDTPATCAVEEGSHITTFDGKTYTFHGDCFYTLAKVESKLVRCAHQEFDTCLKSLKILLNNDRNNVLTFTSDGKVKQNTQTISLPYQAADITIFKASSFHIMFQTTFGLQIQIQHVPIMQVYVSLTQAYRTKTRGLCGNYNKVMYDEMKTPQGIVEGTAVLFANSWKRCTYASCNCDKSEACLCAVLSSYARACASKGVFLIGWRDSVCEKYGGTCPPSQTFSYKHQRCQLTCRSLGSQQSCTSDFLPVDGCSCPEDHYLNEKEICVPKAKCPCYHNEVCVLPISYINSLQYLTAASNTNLFLAFAPVEFCIAILGDSNHGLLEDGKGSCVKESDCPCQRNKRLYAPGKQIKNQCNTCTCRSGRWECTEEKCPETCIIYGSGHYSTFDERKYAFQGHCAYVAVKNNCGNKTAQHNFGVITENVPCGTTGTTCSKIVRIQLGRKEIKLSKGKYEEGDLDQGTDIPYKIRTAGLYLVVESSIGLAVMWDRRTTVRIFLETQHSGEVCGLCGNFDGDGENDFTTQGQLVVSSATEFANSWKLSSSCPDAEANVDPCVLKPHRHHWAKMMCSIITSDTFKDCRSLVDPLPFHDNCVKDSCSCDTGGDCECFCTAVAAYAQACSEAGVCVSWRTPEICPVFCDYYNSPGDCQWHYHPCHKPIYKTCLNPDGIILNPLPELEGCYPVCPEDKPIFDEEKNICVEACEISTTTTPTESTTSTTSTTPPTESTTTEESTTTTSTTTTASTTPTESTTTTASTTPTTQPTTTPTESTTTTASTTPTTQPTTTPTESTTSTTSTTPPTESTTTEESTTTTASTIPPTITPCVPTCEWSQWYDVYDPITDGNDFETYENIAKSGLPICDKKMYLECKSTLVPEIDFDDFVSASKQKVSCDINYGLICKKVDQQNRPYKCLDYKIRVCCEIYQCENITTTTRSTTPPTQSTTTEESTTTTASTTPPTQPTTTPTESTTTTASTTPPTQPTTTPTESTTTTASTTPPTQPTTTPTESTTTTASTTPPTKPTTTPTESTTTTTSTTPTTQPTTTPTESTTSTTSTTPPTESTTTEESTTTTASTTPPTQPTTTPTESTTTTASTTPPTQPTTTPTESTTTTTSTTPPTQSTTTEESTTTTASTTPTTQPTTTLTESTTTTTSTTPTTQPTTTPTESTTSTTSTTPPTESTTTEESTTTTASTTPPTQPTTTPTESTTTTTSTTPPTQPTTTPTESTTTTTSTTPTTQPTTTPTESTTSTTSTTPPTESTTTEESTTTTASTTPPTQPTTTPTESTTTTTSTTPTTQPTTTPTESTTSTTSTTPPTESTTTEESTTTTASTTPLTQPTTTPTESTTTTTSTTPTTQPTTTPTESTTRTTSTTPPTESTTTEESTTTTASTTPPTQPTTTPTESTTTTTSTTPPTITPCVPTCEWSQWYDVYDPITDGNDFETYENIEKSGLPICDKKMYLECKSTLVPEIDFDDFVSASKQKVSCDINYGLICKKVDQQNRPYKCLDYKIRVCCEIYQCENITTTTRSTTPPTQSTTTEESTTTTASTTPPTQPTTTPTESTTTTASTTPPTQSTTTEESTTTTSTTTTASTTPTTQPTTTPTESTTSTTSTTPPTESTTTEESTTTTTSTTPPTESTTTEESTTTTASTTSPTQPTTTPTESTTTTASTTPPTQPTTTPTESTTTTTSTTPTTQPTTTPTESTTSTTSTTPPTESTTTEESTTTTASTTPPTQPTTTPTESTTTTTSTTPTTQPTTTPTESTTSTTSTTPPTESTTTEESTTTTASTTPPTQPTTTPTESTTTTTSTTPTTQPTTTPTESTTSTTSTTPPTESTTTEESTTTTTSTTPPTQPTTTPTESTTTTTSTTPPTQPTTTPTESTTTTASTTPPTQPTTTPTESTTTTTSTTPPTQSTTTEESTTTTASTTPPTQPTTTPTESTTTTASTTPPTQPTTTPTESTTSTTSTTPPTESTTTEESTTTTASTTPPTQPTTTPTESTTTTASTTPPTQPTTTPTESTTTTQNEIFFLCNCTMARCIENNTIEIIPYECPPLQNITCANGKKPVLVYDEHHCCQHYACDCACEGWGDPHYITFDGLYYSYQGNCTYVLMEEIIKRYDLKIYIDNVYCDPVERVSCPRSIIISYHSLKFRLINHNLMGAVLQHDARLKLPYSQYGVKIVDSGINLIFEIPHLRVVITFGIIGFSVDLPYQYFGRNTQGHCGTCNNNQMDDCMLPQGELVASCTAMADYWFAHNIAQPNCKVPPVLPTQPEPQPTVSQCTPDPICELLKTSVFEECHRFVSPDHFYQGCVFDSCRMSNPTVECISLQTYAAACAQSGVCIHWRNHTTICGSNCPANKVYKPCGPAEQPTCEDNPNEPHMNYTTEGCYCPDGMKLFNKESGVCVHKCGCLDPEGIPREFNEIFEYNFQECICEESTKTVTCKPKACPPQTVLSCPDPGFVLVNETDPSNLWCPRLVCRKTLASLHVVSNMKCPLGHIPSASVPEGKCCLEHTCVPANQCQNCTCTNEVDLKTGLLKINCDFLECKEDCDEGYEYVEDDTECCGKCVQTHCAFSFNGTNKLLMVSWIIAVYSKSCKVISMKKRILHNGCQSNQEVDIPYCEGRCNTFMKYSDAAAVMEHRCSCCKEVRHSNRTVDLHCMNGEVVPHTYMHVEQCGCNYTECFKPARRRRSITQFV